MKKKLMSVVWIALVFAALFTLTACATTNPGSSQSAPASVAASTGASSQTSAQAGQTIVVGSKDFTENLVVAEIYALALEDNGFTVDRKFNIGSSVVHTAITSSQIDTYPEYTGTGLLSILKLPLITDPQKVYDTVKDEYKKQFNIAWLDYSPANDSQGLVISTAIAEQLGIKTISDLQKNADKIRFASQGEFDQREDGLPALEKTYGSFNFKSKAVYDNGLKYSILSNNQADLAVAYTTEGQLVDPKFTVLEDDKHVWPPYNLAPIVRQEVLDKNPTVADILNKVSATIDTKIITRLNAEVDVDKREYTDVAKEFYDSIKQNIKG